jgi:hypothetical protein
VEIWKMNWRRESRDAEKSIVATAVLQREYQSWQ